MTNTTESKGILTTKRSLADQPVCERCARPMTARDAHYFRNGEWVCIECHREAVAMALNLRFTRRAHV